MTDYRLTITVKDVAPGDMRMLGDAIMDEHGEAFDASRGDFEITASVKSGAAWFPIDLYADDE